MAYKVLQSFRDEQTRIVYKTGSEYPTDAPANRIEKLTKLSFIEEAEENNADEIEATVSEKNTVDEIKALLDAKGIQYQSKATKAELLSLLEE